MGLLILGGNSASQHLEDETLDFVFRSDVVGLIHISDNRIILYFRLHDENNDGDIEKCEAEKVGFTSLNTYYLNIFPWRPLEIVIIHAKTSVGFSNIIIYLRTY